MFITYDGTAKILDLGIAKVDHVEHTQAGVLKGKVRYMAPEQVGGKKVDRRTDVFAAGIVLWELTVGRRLFEGTDVEALLKIANQDAPAPSTVCADYPREVEAIVMKALQRDPARRYQTARDMQQAIEAYAREAKLTLSAAGLEAFMGQAFAEELLAVDEAQRAGKPLSAHLMEVRTRESNLSRSGIVAGSRSHGGATQPTVAPRPRRRALVAAGVTVAALLVGAAAWALIGSPARHPPGSPGAAGLAAPAAVPEETIPPPIAAAPAGTESAATPTATAGGGEATATAAPAAAAWRSARPYTAALTVGKKSKPAGAREGSSADDLRAPAVNCNPPYTVDTNGIEHFKPGCL